MTDLTESLTSALHSRTLRLPRLPSLGLTNWRLNALTSYYADAKTDVYLTALGQLGAAGRKRERDY